MGATRRSIAVFGAFAAMFATSPGQTFVISNYNGHVGESLDMAASTLAGAYLIGTLMSAGSLTFAGRLADRIGPRHMMALASVGLAIAGFAFSRAQGFVSLAFAFYLLRFFGQGTLSLASSHALALRFDAKLGSIEGLKGAVFSGAIALMPQVALGAIGTYGWREAAWMLPCGAAAVGLVSAYVLLDPDPRVDRKPAANTNGHETMESGFTLAEARRTRAFLVLVGSSAFTGAAITAVHFHLQVLLREAGMGEATAAATFSSFAAAGFFATLFGGMLVDRIRPAPILAMGMALLISGVAGTALAPGAVLAHAGMATLGLGHGFIGAVAGTTLARFFGKAHHGAIRGASATAVVAGAACGPYLVGLVAEAVGSYSWATCGMAFAALPLPFIGWSLRAPAPPRDQDEG